MYEHFYGFSEKPFQLTPDPRFFFASDSHQRAMSYLRYGLSQGEGFIVVTGPIGTGKSTLVRNLLSELSDNRVVAAQLVSTNLAPGDLLQLVADAFGVQGDFPTKAGLLKAIEQFLSGIYRRGQRALLVVDEAQNLPAETVEELRMLSNFQRNNKPLFQSFLLGQEELKQTIESPGMEQFRQRVIASCHLEALSESELVDYIEHRLSRVGWQGCPKISEQAMLAIHEATAGIPRRVNLFCDRLLLFGYLEELADFDLETVQAVAKDLYQEPAAKKELSEPVADQPMAAASSANNPVAGIAASPYVTARDVDKVANIATVAHYLDQQLVEKVALLRQLDEQIAAKREQLELLNASAEVSSSPPEEENVTVLKPAGEMPEVSTD
ncbi:general secretion pathway protein GspA [Corallincola luteus]|uniref:General secretion pathway protein GspA n=1 Tax=Corallincola luteus TaxID=1775177 RepID=A0ABY2AMN0_9GAMM|nr:XrtA/PEP-CTERM system-associated ATPase [Corallincola luteus]TCI04458.1 general secretion pathway protein GspA [Corallincola luteus]